GRRDGRGPAAVPSPPFHRHGGRARGPGAGVAPTELGAGRRLRHGGARPPPRPGRRRRPGRRSPRGPDRGGGAPAPPAPGRPRRAARVGFLPLDVARDPVPGAGGYDAVISVDARAWEPDPVPHLEGCRRALRPGGYGLFFGTRRGGSDTRFLHHLAEAGFEVLA